MIEEKEMFFFIADISGYTEYMIQNRQDYTHAKITISTLIETLVKKIKIPLEIAKLEGDAIFLYLLKERMTKEMIQDRMWIEKKIYPLFSLFSIKLHELSDSRICTCGACANLEKLNLKVIFHYGTASIQKIGRFKELTGVDVIILHRLLKNPVPLHRYLLLTEPAFQQVLISPDSKISKMEETYPEIGPIAFYVCEPPETPPEEMPNCNTFWYKAKQISKLEIKTFLSKLGLGGSRHFHNLPPKTSQ